ncbi:MAG: ATP-binding protein [Dehalococcoidia bacterium]|nr:ATP-binding protein [Dehalococcoidia bacterium]
MAGVRGKSAYCLNSIIHTIAHGQIVHIRLILLLEHHLKQLKPSISISEYDKITQQCVTEGVHHPDYLPRPSEPAIIDRHHRMVHHRNKAGRFPTVKSMDTFDFLAIPSVNRQLVNQLAMCEYVERQESVTAMGNSGTGKTHLPIGLGLAAYQM